MPVMLSDRLVGCRVVVRYRRPDADDGRPPLSDLVGELVVLTADRVTVRTRSGDRTVHRADVLVARPVAASRREVLELARISRLGWRAAHSTEVGGWLLQANAGWTGRANSALPLRTSDRPLDEQLAAARRFYDGHGLPLLIQLPLPARGLLDAELAGRCWRRVRPVAVLTRPLAALAEPALPVRIAEQPDDRWLAAYHYRGAPLPEAGRQLLVRHPHAGFASVELDGRLVAIGRGTVDEGWLGLTAIEVDPDYRRQGVATALIGALAGWALGAGPAAATRCYLQAEDENEPAARLYQRLGFTEHHRYHYRAEPAG